MAHHEQEICHTQTGQSTPGGVNNPLYNTTSQLVSERPNSPIDEESVLILTRPQRHRKPPQRYGEWVTPVEASTSVEKYIYYVYTL